MLALGGSFYSVARHAPAAAQRAVLLWSAMPMLAAFSALHAAAHAAAARETRDAKGVVSILMLECALFVLAATAVLLTPSAQRAK